MNLSRFLEAQNQLYLRALAEIRGGKKASHWMWFIFPQLKGLGKSETARFYGIENMEEATAYLAHPVLGSHLIEISETLLQLDGLSATAIFGTPDDLKLRSSMTLFDKVQNSHPVFRKVLQKYFGNCEDSRTLEMLSKQHV